jgi:hypothetical protein
MGVSAPSHALAAIYPRGKDPRYPLYRRLGVHQIRFNISDKGLIAGKVDDFVL